MIDTNDLAEGLENLVPFLIVSAIVALIVLALTVRIFGNVFVRLAISPQGRMALAVFTVAALVVGGGTYVFTNLEMGGEAWVILGAIVVAGVPLGWLLTSLLEDDSADTDSDGESGTADHSIWR